MSDDPQGVTTAAWAALAMKECIQEPICSIWTHFCRSGVQRQRVDGMSPDELSEMIRDLADGRQLTLNDVSLAVLMDERASDVSKRLAEAARSLSWDELTRWTADENTASSGLVALLVLAERVPDARLVHPLWGEIAGRRSEHQDGLLGIVSLLRRRLTFRGRRIERLSRATRLQDVVEELGEVVFGVRGEADRPAHEPARRAAIR